MTNGAKNTNSPIVILHRRCLDSSCGTDAEETFDPSGSTDSLKMRQSILKNQTPYLNVPI